MSIGPSSKWRCEEGCGCGGRKDKRCREKVSLIQEGDSLLSRWITLLYKLDLGEVDVRRHDFFRHAILEWKKGSK